MADEQQEKKDHKECRGAWADYIPQEQMEWFYNAFNNFVDDTAEVALRIGPLNEFVIQTANVQVLQNIARNPSEAAPIIASVLEALFEVGRMFEREAPFKYERLPRDEAAEEMLRLGREHFEIHHPEDELPEFLREDYEPPSATQQPQVIMLPVSPEQLARMQPQKEESEEDFHPGGYI